MNGLNSGYTSPSSNGYTEATANIQDSTDGGYSQLAATNGSYSQLSATNGHNTSGILLT